MSGDLEPIVAAVVGGLLGSVRRLSCAVHGDWCPLGSGQDRWLDYPPPAPSVVEADDEWEAYERWQELSCRRESPGEAVSFARALALVKARNLERAESWAAQARAERTEEDRARGEEYERRVRDRRSPLVRGE